MAETEKILAEKFKDGKINNQYIPEILEQLANISSFRDRVAALQANSDRSLNTILWFTFREERPRLSKEDVETLQYKPAPSDLDYSIAPSTLYDVSKRLYLFYREDLTVEKMKDILTEMLENLHPDEAEILKGIFIGKQPYNYVTIKLVRTAFPDLFPAPDQDIDKSKTEESTQDQVKEPKEEA